MGIKILAFIGILVVGSVAVQQLRSKRSVDEVLLKGRIRLAAETAKEKNQSEITIAAPIPIYAEVRDLDAALAKYSTVIVRLVSRHSFISSDTKEITTWYKFEVTDFLSQPTAKSCNSCPSAKSMPSEVSPTKENEILLVRLVGTVVEGGVRVTSVDRNFPDFQFNKQYLLFIEMDLQTRIASIALGPEGVSTIEPDGQVSSVSSATRLNSELRKRFGKVENVKSALRFRRFPEH